MHELLAGPARATPDATAVEGPPGDDSITYRELDALSDRVRDGLRGMGVRPGDRVGLQLLGENTCFYQHEELLP